MCNFKISKKEALSDTRSSLFDLHERKLNYFDNKKDSIKQYKEEINTLRLKLFENGNINENNKNEYTIKKRIKELETLIYNIESDVDLKDYLLEFVDLFYKHEKKNKEPKEISNDFSDSEQKGSLDNFINSTLINDKAELYNEYIKKFNPELKQIDKRKIEEHFCKNCNENNFTFDSRNSDEICINCGLTTRISCIEEYDYSTSIENEQINTSFNYKRNNHFQECLNQLQAKENTTIPPKIIKDLTIEFKKYNITDPKLFNYFLVKEHLRKLKYNKYYEHIPTIINEFCGLPAPVLTPALEQQLKIMFDQIQTPFEKHSKIISPKRKNFLNYNYVFYKMCQILNKQEFLSFFPLLKSREKLYEHEQIWKGICSELKWKFIPSI